MRTLLPVSLLLLVACGPIGDSSPQPLCGTLKCDAGACPPGSACIDGRCYAPSCEPPVLPKDDLAVERPADMADGSVPIEHVIDMTAGLPDLPCAVNFGKPCDDCGGTVKCDGSCSIPNPPG